MNPLQSWPAFGLPCDRCAQPARRVEVYPNGRRIVHRDQRVRPCDLPNQTEVPRKL
jgi:hypothetical protein